MSLEGNLRNRFTENIIATKKYNQSTSDKKQHGSNCHSKLMKPSS